MNNVRKIKMCVIAAVLILLLNIGSTTAPLLIKAQTITSGYKLKVDYNDEGYATISADTSQVTSGYQLVSLTDKDGKDVSDDPANFSQKVTKDGIYTYTLNYTLNGIDESQTQSEEVTVKVAGIEKNDTPEDTKTYQITNNFNANNDYQDVTINPQKDVTAGQKVTVSFTWPQTVQAITAPKITGADGQDLTANVDVTNIKNDATTRQYEFTFTMPAQDVSLSLETTQATNKVELDDTTYQPIYSQTSSEIKDTVQSDTWEDQGRNVTVWANFRYGTGDSSEYKQAKSAGKIYYAVYRKDNSASSQYQLLWGSKDGDDTNGGTSDVDSRIKVSGLQELSDGSLNQNGNFWLSVTLSNAKGSDHGSNYRIVAFTDANNAGVNVGDNGKVNYPTTLTDDFLTKVPSVTNAVKILSPLIMVNGNAKSGTSSTNNLQKVKVLASANKTYDLTYTVKSDVNYSQTDLNYLVNKNLIDFWFAAKNRGSKYSNPTLWYWDNAWASNPDTSWMGHYSIDGRQGNVVPKVYPGIKANGDGTYTVSFSNISDGWYGLSYGASDGATYYGYVWMASIHSKYQFPNMNGVPPSPVGSYTVPSWGFNENVNGSNRSVYGISNVNSITVPGCIATTYLINDSVQSGKGSSYSGLVTYPSEIKMNNVTSQADDESYSVESDVQKIQLHTVYTDASGKTHVDEGNITPDTTDFDYPYDFSVKFASSKDLISDDNGTTLTLHQLGSSSSGTITTKVTHSDGTAIKNYDLGTLKFAFNNNGTAIKELDFKISGTLESKDQLANVWGSQVGYVFSRVTPNKGGT